MRLSFLLVLCLCCLALAKAQRKSLGSHISRFSHLTSLGSRTPPTGGSPSEDSKVSPKAPVLIATITNNLKFAARGAVTIANNQQIRYNVAAGATMQVTQTKPFLVHQITASYTANNVGYSCKPPGINGKNQPKVVISLIGKGPQCQIKQTIGTGK